MTIRTMNILNIIVAGGSGSRFGADRPKQYCLLNGKPVLMHTIQALESAIPHSHTVIVIAKEMERLWLNLCSEYSFTSPHIVYGGSSRWHSVKNAIDAESDYPADIITVHDGARPLVDSRTVIRTIEACRTHQGAIPSIALSDSIRRMHADGSSTAENRTDFRAVQTPQAFRAELLRRAYCLPFSPTFTDDASVMAACGFDDIVCVDGNVSNIKITNPLDIKIAELYLNGQC